MVDILEALKKSLELARKPPATAEPETAIVEATGTAGPVAVPDKASRKPRVGKPAAVNRRPSNTAPIPLPHPLDAAVPKGL